MELIIPSERRLHAETHVHQCPIHHRGKCTPFGQELCMFTESNEVCQKTLRGTGLEFHTFPCINCMMTWRANYGGETLVDSMVDLEQAARATHVIPDAKADAREQREAESNPEVEEYVKAQTEI